jgi:hypothetical protein
MNYYYDCEVLGDRIEEMEELIKESNIMDTMLEGRNRVMDQINTGEFQTYNICDVMDWIYSTFAPGKNQWEMSYDWESEKVRQFCDNFNVYLYEKPREYFFKWEGVEEAYKAGKLGVILSDLS